MTTDQHSRSYERYQNITNDILEKRTFTCCTDIINNLQLSSNNQTARDTGRHVAVISSDDINAMNQDNRHLMGNHTAILSSNTTNLINHHSAGNQTTILSSDDGNSMNQQIGANQTTTISTNNTNSMNHNVTANQTTIDTIPKTVILSSNNTNFCTPPVKTVKMDYNGTIFIFFSTLFFFCYRPIKILCHLKYYFVIVI